MHALDFVRDVLVDQLRIHAMVIGYDHRFGRNREGDINLLRQLGEAYDFLVEEIPAQEDGPRESEQHQGARGLAQG